jgi:tyrosyl-tRNA synthetase
VRVRAGANVALAARSGEAAAGVPNRGGSLALVPMDSAGGTPPSRPPGGPAGQAAWLARNAVECLPEGVLEAKLALGRPLRVKLGIDPTAPDIHLGHTVVLDKLREFQDLGHEVVLIVGDFTARVGDPSGRSATRPVLSVEEIERNALTYQEQAFAILDRDRLRVRRNSEWLEQLGIGGLFALMRDATVAQILERDDFARRWRARTPISVLELLYPLLQGYDSVAIRADVELGGTDQKFNLLLARDIQRAYGVAEQAVLTTPILSGTDGVQRMSKSLGNYVGVADPAEEIYGKTLSIPDEVLGQWYSLLLDRPPDPALGPRDAKRALARALVERFHGSHAAQAAEEAFDRVHVRHEPPAELDEVAYCPAPAGNGDAPLVHLPALLRAAFGVSGSEARRALSQGGVRLDGEPLVPDPLDRPASELDGRVLQLGKRRFARVRIEGGS